MEKHVLKMALNDHCVITIMYQKDNEITMRNIIVKAVEGKRVKAYCLLRKETRIFNIDNILAAEIYRNKRMVFN